MSPPYFFRHDKPSALRNDFLVLSDYVASATFLVTAVWKEGIADVLVNKSDGGMKTWIIVGEFLDDCLFWRPNRNYTVKGPYAKPLEEPRFSLFLAKPDIDGFTNDFDLSQSKFSDVGESVPDYRASIFPGDIWAEQDIYDGCTSFRTKSKPIVNFRVNF